jgi:serine/threonine protein kinase
LRNNRKQSAATHMSVEGQRFGEFEIIERIGEGAMGAVYKARQVSLDRIVALKMLQPSLADNADFIARFRQEAKAAAVLNHPNLVQVISAGETAGLYWFAMEYVDGESARARLKREGRLNPMQAIAIALYVAAALEYGWRKAALIHRDIKPDNIFLSADGEVKLGDLGLAKSAGQTQGLTMTGASMGTPHYISPEQVEAMKDVDLRADIYSLGCTLYHMLCGQPPYVGNSSAAVMVKHMSDPAPDLRTVWPECPAELATAILKMMQKNPADRQQSYEEVRADLRRGYDASISGTILSVPPVPAQPATVEKKAAVSVAVWVSGATVLFAIASATLFLALRKDGSGRATPTAPISGSTQVRSTASPRPSPTPSLERSINERVAIVVPKVSPTAKPSIPNTPQITHGSVAVPAPATTEPPTPAATAVKASPKPGEPPQSTPVAKVDIPKWLEEIDAQYREPYQREVIKPYDDGMAQLKQGYLASIDRLLNAASRAAKLEDAIVLRTERQRAAESDGIPTDDLDVPLPSIKVLRVWYRAQAAKLEQARAQGAKAQFERYDAVLAAGQAQLTQRQRLDEAMLLKIRREQIATEWLRKETTSPLASSTAPLPTPTTAITRSTPAIKQGAESASSRKPPASEIAAGVPSASKTAPFVNSLGMKFVPVPIIGGTASGRRVLFSIWDTRVQDYEVFAGEAHRAWPKPDFPQSPTHPAINVAWDDSDEFCKWLTSREQSAGLLPSGWGYRLPSDHEWSCAADIGAKEDANAAPADKNAKVKNAFPWGTVWPPPRGAGNFAGEELKPALSSGKYSHIHGVITGYNDGFVETSPVGSFKANRFGLFDMGGNVWQWCDDWINTQQMHRVVRGASWSGYLPEDLLLSRRFQSAPGAKYSTSHGFRCVLAPAR